MTWNARIVDAWEESQDRDRVRVTDPAGLHSEPHHPCGRRRNGAAHQFELACSADLNRAVRPGGHY